jgi:hypothetical protein
LISAKRKFDAAVIPTIFRKRRYDVYLLAWLGKSQQAESISPSRACLAAALSMVQRV